MNASVTSLPAYCSRIVLPPGCFSTQDVASYTPSPTTSQQSLPTSCARTSARAYVASPRRVFPPDARPTSRAASASPPFALARPRPPAPSRASRPRPRVVARARDAKGPRRPAACASSNRLASPRRARRRRRRVDAFPSRARRRSARVARVERVAVRRAVNARRPPRRRRRLRGDRRKGEKISRTRGESRLVDGACSRNPVARDPPCVTTPYLSPPGFVSLMYFTASLKYAFELFYGHPGHETPYSYEHHTARPARRRARAAQSRGRPPCAPARLARRSRTRAARATNDARRARRRTDGARWRRRRSSSRTAGPGDDHEWAVEEATRGDRGHDVVRGGRTERAAEGPGHELATARLAAESGVAGFLGSGARARGEGTRARDGLSARGRSRAFERGRDAGRGTRDARGQGARERGEGVTRCAARRASAR